MKTIVTFGYRLRNPPTGAPYVDCRHLPNPFRTAKTDEERIEIVKKHTLFAPTVEVGVKLLEMWDEIWVGCEFGKHRSGAVAEGIAEAFEGTVRIVKK